VHEAARRKAVSPAGRAATAPTFYQSLYAGPPLSRDCGDKSLRLLSQRIFIVPFDKNLTSVSLNGLGSKP